MNSQSLGGISNVEIFPWAILRTSIILNKFAPIMKAVALLFWLRVDVSISGFHSDRICRIMGSSSGALLREWSS